MWLDKKTTTPQPPTRPRHHGLGAAHAAHPLARPRGNPRHAVSSSRVSRGRRVCAFTPLHSTPLFTPLHYTSLPSSLHVTPIHFRRFPSHRVAG